MAIIPISYNPLPLSNMEPEDLRGGQDKDKKISADAGKQDVEVDGGDLKIPLEKVVKKLNGIEAFQEKGIRFYVDKETRKVVIRIVDSSTNEVIRQIPPEEVLNITRHIDEFQGLLLNRKG